MVAASQTALFLAVRTCLHVQCKICVGAQVGQQRERCAAGWSAAIKLLGTVQSSVTSHKTFVISHMSQAQPPSSVTQLLGQ